MTDETMPWQAGGCCPLCGGGELVASRFVYARDELGRETGHAVGLERRCRCRTTSGPSEIELYSGGYLDLTDPDPRQITLDDVAYGLSREHRYAGQTALPLTVAEHACLVARRVRDVGGTQLEQLAALHHDDSEALVKDVPAPLKRLLPGYKEIESRVMNAILSALGLDGLEVDSQVVHDADLWARAQEAHELMRDRGDGWTEVGGHRWDGKWRRLGEMTGEDARVRWLSTHYLLNATAGLRAFDE